MINLDIGVEFYEMEITKLSAIVRYEHFRYLDPAYNRFQNKVLNLDSEIVVRDFTSSYLVNYSTTIATNFN